MTRVIIPAFLRQDGNTLIASMMAYARMLQVRLIDKERRHKSQSLFSASGTDIIRAVARLDSLCRELSDIVGGAPCLRDNPDCMRHTMEFRAYCDREFAYQDKRRLKRQKALPR